MSDEQQPIFTWRENMIALLKDIQGEQALMKKSLDHQGMELRSQIATVRDHQIEGDKERHIIGSKIDGLKLVVLDGNGESHRAILKEHERRLALIESEKVLVTLDKKEDEKQKRTQRRGALYGVAGTLAASILLAVLSVMWADHKVAQSLITTQAATDKAAESRDLEIQRAVEVALKKAAEAQKQSASAPVVPRTVEPAEDQNQIFFRPTLKPRPRRNRNRNGQGLLRATSSESVASLHGWARPDYRRTPESIEGRQ